MATKNKKRGQRIIKLARQRKRERFRTLTPKQRREYEEARKRRKNGSYVSNYELSRKENIVAAIIAVFSAAAICGIIYLIYLGIKFVISLGG